MGHFAVEIYAHPGLSLNANQQYSIRWGEVRQVNAYEHIQTIDAGRLGPWRGGCNANQPCPTASAIEAGDALVRLLGKARGRSQEGHVLLEGPSLNCVSDGGAGGKRTAA